jgi:hypothetical protein
LRYAHGIILGALFPGIIFMGSAVIKILGFGVEDPLVLSMLWNIYTIWFVISVILLAAPLIIVFAARREMAKEFFLYEFGGLSLFMPLWFVLATEISGDSWITVLLTGVESGIPFVNASGQFVGVGVGTVLLLPVFIVLALVGLYILRPSFIERYGAPGSLPELDALKETPAAPPKPVEDEMPDVAPPVADENTIEELRKLLTDLAVPSGTIDAILAAGFETVTDLVATSAEQIASAAGIDRKTAQDIHLAIQKKVWFGGI